MPHLVYEINTHVWLREQSQAGGPRDLGSIPEETVRQWAEMGVDAVWLLGVWTKGKATRRICLESSDLKAALEQALPGHTPDQVIGSPFSIAEYSLDPALGDSESLSRLRAKLNNHGIRLLLDFVPNHLAVDHALTATNPNCFVTGSEVELERSPGNYFRVEGQPETILAHGRDPYFSGWTDTVQLNLFSTDARAFLTKTLLSIGECCDGVRCDMAMLMTNDVFIQTWGDLSVIEYPSGAAPEFWPEAIAAVKKQHPGFLFVAEVYWGLERKLQEMGFDFTYDKTLYDLARSGDGAGIRKLLHDTRDCESRMVRFLENHDESRAACAFGRRLRALATMLSVFPGLKLFHEGQLESRRVRLPVQLAARPNEVVDEEMREFYLKLLRLSREPVMREGAYRPLYVSEAWEGNHTAAQIVTCSRSHYDAHRLMVANVGEMQAQAYTEIPEEFLQPEVIEFHDLLTGVVYYRDSSRLKNFGLYLDIPGGGYHLFDVRPAPSGKMPDPH